VAADISEQDKRRAQLTLVWKDTTTERTRLGAYLEHRGLPANVLDVVDPLVLRFHPALPYFDGDGHHRGDYPTMVCKVVDLDGQGVTLHRTYLSCDGPGKLELEGQPAKKLMTPIADGATRGAAIRLCSLRSTLGLAEGVETALAVLAATGQHVWAAGSAGSLEEIQLPEDVTQVHVWTDRDLSGRGERAAEKAAERLCREGRRVFIHVSPLLP
jgi:putative DNA primase/helicase